MNNTILQALAQYDVYANRILFDTASKLSIEELGSGKSSTRSVVITASVSIHRAYQQIHDFKKISANRQLV